MLGAESESLPVNKTLKSDRNSRLSIIGWVPSRGLPSTKAGCSLTAAGQMGSRWLAGRFEKEDLTDGGGGGRRKDDRAAGQPSK